MQNFHIVNIRYLTHDSQHKKPKVKTCGYMLPKNLSCLSKINKTFVNCNSWMTKVLMSKLTPLDESNKVPLKVRTYKGKETWKSSFKKLSLFSSFGNGPKASMFEFIPFLHLPWSYT